jgi:hedgehog signaling domain-containing protein
MKAKAGVKLIGCGFEIGFAAGIVSGIFKSDSIELVVTSANDSTHSTNSLHYKGRAIDIRTRTIPAHLRSVVFGKIKTELDPQGFDCVDEGDHFHIEFDPKPGERFLTVVP